MEITFDSATVDYVHEGQIVQLFNGSHSFADYHNQEQAVFP